GHFLAVDQEEVILALPAGDIDIFAQFDVAFGAEDGQAPVTTGEVIASSIGNFGMPDKPAFEDFGEVLLRSDKAEGYVRVDWFKP
ncbi:hypothetical protein AB9F38_34750, partial [Rhizobium leguminosarum]